MHNGLKHVMTLATQVAKKPSPVLLMGETGTGKEVIATAIHRISDRNDGPFISLNCGAIPETLVDSELFGHEKGAFTGANERKRGRFERADGGTLFLDEVGELPASAQVKLLRVLQEKEFERVGGSHPVRANVRLIAATNRNLPDMIRKGLFREDLWFRLNVFPIEIPPLRQRREDIIPLAYFFIETKIRQLNIPFQPPLPAEELNKLALYDWPGNVRELQNTIERALILSRGEPLHFPLLNNEPGKVGSYTTSSLSKSVSDTAFPSLEEATRTYLIELLHRTGGKIAGAGGAAEVSGLNPSTLRSKLKKLGIRKIETHV
jgi:transcriptional regulator with GAF, ATPase, and Fis domain